MLLHLESLLKQRVFRFLQGLHKDFDSVRSRLLATKPFPTLNSAFSEVRLEESRIRVMMGTSHGLSDSSALSISKDITDNSSALAVYKGPSQGKKPLCKFCNKHGHSFDNCYSRPDSKVQRPTFRNFGGNWKNKSSWKPPTQENWRSFSQGNTSGSNWKGGKDGQSQGTMAHFVNQMGGETDNRTGIQSEHASVQGNHPNPPPIQHQLDAILKLLGKQ